MIDGLIFSFTSYHSILERIEVDIKAMQLTPSLTL